MKAFKSFRSFALFELSVACPFRARCVTLDCRAREVHIDCPAIHLNNEPPIRSLPQHKHLDEDRNDLCYPRGKRNKTSGGVALYFLTYKYSPIGRLPIQAQNVFKKIHSLPPPHPKELLEDTMYAVYPTYKLRLNFYIGVLMALTVMTEIVYNFFEGTKFVYATLLNILCLTFYVPLLLHGNFADARLLNCHAPCLRLC